MKVQFFRGSCVKLLAVLTVAYMLFGNTMAHANSSQIDLDPPKPGYYISDNAGMLSNAHMQAVDEIVVATATDLSIPIYVVTVESMARYDRRNRSIERFARRLYEQWGAHPQFDARAYWRHGVLLIVSQGDRSARIELGADWGGKYDKHCERIMSEVLVPNFRNGDYSTGITAGVEALDVMARGGPPPPRAEMPEWLFLTLLVVGVVGAILIILLIGRLIDRLNGPGRRRRYIGDGFDHVAWGENEYGNGSSWGGSGYGGGGFGGGGFGGGGFGGGGGATGSW